MPQKKFVFRQLSRYICTRRIQFTLQNLHVVSFSNNGQLPRAASSESEIYKMKNSYPQRDSYSRTSNCEATTVAVRS